MVKVIKHPLLTHKLTLLRKKKTPYWLFNQVLNEITTLLAYEAFADLKLKTIEIQTPICKTKAEQIKDDVLIVSILRAGNSMSRGMFEAFPLAKIGHIGLERNEDTFEPRTYYDKLPPNFTHAKVLLVDPMLATGGSAINALRYLANKGYKNIRFMSIIATKQGIDRLQKEFPDIDIYTLSIDPKLTDKKYISPGLGDAGDRYFGTE